MNAFIRSKFISDFELLSVALPLQGAEERLFCDMAGIYRIANTEAEYLYGLCSDPRVLGIRTKLDFGSYQWASDSSASEASELDAVIRARGEAIARAVKSRLVSVTAVTPTERFRNLGRAASNGDVCALYALGVAFGGGYGTDVDGKQALSCLKQAAHWNFAAAAIYLMAYDADNAAEYAATLYTSTVNSCRKHVAEFVTECGYAPATDRRAEILDTIVSAGEVKADVIDFSVARILYSEVLSDSSKEGVLFSHRKEILAEAASIADRIPPAALNGISVSAPLSREEDGKKLARMLCGFANAGDVKYRPIMICSDEACVRDAYEESLRGALESCNIIDIDTEKTAEEFFEADSRNIVVSSLSRRKPNIVFFKMHGAAAPAKVNFIKKFLDTSQRSDMRFFMSVGLTLNLANVVPVVFSDVENADFLRKVCVVLSPEPTTKAERAAVINSSCAHLSFLYGMKDVTIGEDVMRCLTDMDIDSVLLCLARMVCATGDDRRITQEIMRDEMTEALSVPIGFRETERG